MAENVKKYEQPRRAFEGELGWVVPPQSHQTEIIRALSDPTRRWIYEYLEDGPARQVDLSRAAGAEGRNISHVLLIHHIKVLERAGLVKTFMLNRRSKIVQRSGDVRILFRHRNVLPPEELPERPQDLGMIKNIFTKTAEGREPCR